MSNLSDKNIYKTFYGKIISRIDVLGVNDIQIHFTDHSILELEVECVDSSVGLYGMIPSSGSSSGWRAGD